MRSAIRLPIRPSWLFSPLHEIAEVSARGERRKASIQRAEPKPAAPSPEHLATVATVAASNNVAFLELSQIERIVRCRKRFIRRNGRGHGVSLCSVSRSAKPTINQRVQKSLLVGAPHPPANAGRHQCSTGRDRRAPASRRRSVATSFPFVVRRWMRSASSRRAASASRNVRSSGPKPA